MTGKPKRGRKFSSIKDASERRMRIGGLRVIVLASCLHGFACWLLRLLPTRFLCSRIMHVCHRFYVWLPAKMSRSRPIVFGRCVLETGVGRPEMGKGSGFRSGERESCRSLTVLAGTGREQEESREDAIVRNGCSLSVSWTSSVQPRSHSLIEGSWTRPSNKEQVRACPCHLYFRQVLRIHGEDAECDLQQVIHSKISMPVALPTHSVA